MRNKYPSEEIENIKIYPQIYSYLFLLHWITLLLIGVGSYYFVLGLKDSCNRIKRIPEAIIGFTLVAFGTSLPELVTLEYYQLSGVKVDFALGNVLGSNIYNVVRCFRYFIFFW